MGEGVQGKQWKDMKEWKKKERKNKKNEIIDKKWKRNTGERGEGDKNMKGI